MLFPNQQEKQRRQDINRKHEGRSNRDIPGSVENIPNSLLKLPCYAIMTKRCTDIMF